MQKKGWMSWTFQRRKNWACSEWLDGCWKKEVKLRFSTWASGERRWGSTGKDRDVEKTTFQERGVESFKWVGWCCVHTSVTNKFLKPSGDPGVRGPKQDWGRTVTARCQPVSARCQGDPYWGAWGTAGANGWGVRSWKNHENERIDGTPKKIWADSVSQVFSVESSFWTLSLLLI